MIMKAAVYCGKRRFKGKKKYRLGEPEDNEVVIRVKYCGVWNRHPYFHGDGGACDVTLPLIPGHEFSGDS